MNIDHLVTVVVGVFAIAWILWYFLGRRRAARATATGSGVEQITVVVEGGYSPAVIRATAGKKIRLHLNRQETSGCSAEFVLSDFGVRRFLPPYQTTVVEITPEKPGTHEFTCGMNMLRGTLVVA